MEKNGWIISVVIVVILIAIGVYVFSSSKQIQPHDNPPITDLGDKCVLSGGKITSVDCYCSGPQDFFNNCAIGACTCTPDPQYKRVLKSCECPAGMCFNGQECISMIGLE